MSFNVFNDQAMQGAEFALNSLSERQQVLANNIANAQTPGYKAQDVSFESQLSSIFNGASSVDNPNATGDITTSPDQTTSTDGNTVGMESQMSKVGETNLMFNTLTQLTADRLSILGNAISG